MIKEAYVSFETAKLLKEKGFPQEYDNYHALVYNEEDYEDEYEVQRMVLETKLVKAGTLSSYPVGVSEPKCYCCTQQLAMRWLREVHKLPINIWYDKEEDTPDDEVWTSEIAVDRPSYILVGSFASYEEAVEAALKYSLENLI